MLELVTVRFEANKSTADFLAHDVPLRVGDRCIVATKRGVELGMVIDGQKAENLSGNRSKINKALRKATEKDLYLHEKKKDHEVRAHHLCKKMIRTHKLAMKLAKVEYVFDGSRVIFHFTSTSRVDFRSLVKTLARRLRTRIEMRQIGARDEAKLVGGIGCCGTGENCSAKFLKGLKSVSIRAAKKQGLTVSPSRLSGMCGRLKCCLNFEADGVRNCQN
ncbi:MAG: regulatory iron-sulfur-containing complex subunit RicT [Acidobacteriota bacterium]|nr:regulatory iron-sulfur-containing complex subunit RicT [Acidobacteriota bacterium]